MGAVGATERHCQGFTKGLSSAEKRGKAFAAADAIFDVPFPGIRDPETM